MIKILSVMVALVLGACHSWAWRYEMLPDGISYLDMADYLRQGDGSAFVSAQWSPLYPILLACFMKILNPSAYAEFSFLHFVNFLIYLFTLAAFLIFSRAAKKNQTSTEFVAALIFFLYASLDLIGVRTPTPDLLVSGFGYLLAAFLIEPEEGDARKSILIGILLGLAYWAKAAMFFLGLVYLGLYFFRILRQMKSKKEAGSRLLVAFIFFIFISGFWIRSISMAKGRLTFGDAGKLAYARYVNGLVLHTHSSDGKTKAGEGLLHPPKLLLDNPPAYEFSTPVRGTYPMWYDPSYWLEGVKPRFHFRGQLSVFFNSAKNFLNFSRDFLFFVVGLFSFGLFLKHKSHWRESLGRGIWIYWWSLAALGGYSLVNLMSRYIGGFMAILGAHLGSSLAPEIKGGMKTLLFFLFLSPVIFRVCDVSLYPLTVTAHEWVYRKQEVPDPSREIAEALREFGVGSGSDIAFIGDSNNAYWARMARVRIIADIVPGGEPLFWKGSEENRQKALRVFYETGAKGVVARNVPSEVSAKGWKKIGETDHFYYPLSG